MKLRYILFGLLAATATLCYSCSDDNDTLSSSQVPESVQNSFNSMFKNAHSVEWEQNLNFYVAEFSYNTFETDAWYYNNGTWAMTKTDYGSLTNMLPVAIQDSFNQSQYADWIVDDVEMYERLTDSFCIIEVETDGMPEIALFYDIYGDLINKVQGDYFDITPNTIVSDITFGQ